MATARSDDSATVSRPIGLSSRTTSPVSVTHDVVCRPPKERSTRKAGTGRSSTRTTSRAAHDHRHRRIPHRRRIEHRPFVPGALGQALARQPTRETQHQGGRFGELPHLLPGAAAAGDGERQRQPRRGVPATMIGPVPGSSEKVERLEREGLVDARRGLEHGGAGGAEQRHLQAAVFLQLEAVSVRQGLADGKADLLAAIVDAAPLRRGAVSGEIGGQVRRRRLNVGAMHEQAHGHDPCDHDNPGKGAGHSSGNWTDPRHDRVLPLHLLPFLPSAFCLLRPFAFPYFPRPPKPAASRRTLNAEPRPTM